MASEKVAVVGSRDGADLEHVDRFLVALRAKQPDTILVSGGNKSTPRSVDHYAETKWLALGGRVISLRPRQQNRSYVIERWEFRDGQGRVFVLEGEPSWEDWRCAALYRDMLIAELADRVVVFYNNRWSPGSRFTADMSRVAGKFVYEFTA